MNFADISNNTHGTHMKFGSMKIRIVMTWEDNNDNDIDADAGDNDESNSDTTSIGNNILVTMTMIAIH